MVEKIWLEFPEFQFPEPHRTVCIDLTYSQHARWSNYYTARSGSLFLDHRVIEWGNSLETNIITAKVKECNAVHVLNNNSQSETK